MLPLIQQYGQRGPTENISNNNNFSVSSIVFYPKLIINISVRLQSNYSDVRLFSVSLPCRVSSASCPPSWPWARCSGTGWPGYQPWWLWMWWLRLWSLCHSPPWDSQAGTLRDRIPNRREWGENLTNLLSDSQMIDHLLTESHSFSFDNQYFACEITFSISRKTCSLYLQKCKS